MGEKYYIVSVENLLLNGANAIALTDVYLYHTHIIGLIPNG
jgi:hypothetical protein